MKTGYRLRAMRQRLERQRTRTTQALQVLRRGLPPLPTRSDPAHCPDGSIVDYTPLPYPPQGKGWQPADIVVSDTHRDMFTRNLVLARVSWKLKDK